MFQYATAYAYSKRHNKKLKVKGRSDTIFSLFDLNTDELILENVSNLNNVFFEQNRHFLFENEMYNSKYDGLDGFFQNESYFKDYRSDILNKFKFKKELTGINKDLANKIQTDNSVSLHIRRGDYLTDAKNDVLSNHYYLEAINYIVNKIEDPHFYIFSDDIEWVKKNFKITQKHTYIDNNQNSGFYDIQLMNLCKHHIIANSTFSWWAAWLNGNDKKIVIAPKIWLTDKNAFEDTKNIIPREWMRVKEKADIAVVLMSEIDKKDQIENLNKYFLPHDRKKYFSKNDLDKIKEMQFDYVIVLESKILLTKEVGYDVVPFENNGVLYFSYNGSNFVKTDSSSNMISMKYHKDLIFFNRMMK